MKKHLYVIIIPTSWNCYAKSVETLADVDRIRAQKVGAITRNYICNNRQWVLITDAYGKIDGRNAPKNMIATNMARTTVRGRAVLAKWVNGERVGGFNFDEMKEITERITGGVSVVTM